MSLESAKAWADELIRKGEEFRRKEQYEKVVVHLCAKVNDLQKKVERHERQLRIASNVPHSPQGAKTIDASTFIPPALQDALNRLNLHAITRTQWYEYQATAAEFEKLRQKVADIEQIARSCHA